MAPKKPKQEEWNECLKCRRVVHKKDIQPHKEDCAAVHGFVLNRVLHALVCSASLQTKEALSKLPLKNKDDVILVSPSVMGVCDLAIGQPCLVNVQHVLTMWPSDSVPPGSVFLPSLLREAITGSPTGTDSRVTVRRFHPPPGTEAHQVKIDLVLENEAFLTEEFTQILKHKMEGKYIIQDMKHAVRYFGLTCSFCITAIEKHQRPSHTLVGSSPLSPVAASQADSSELCQSLASLDLSGVSDSGDSFNASVPLTPRSESDASPGGLSSAAVTETPVKRNSHPQRPEQFCTPGGPGREGSAVPEESPGFVKVVPQTQFVVVRSSGQEEEGEGGEGRRKRRVTYDSLGGLDAQIAQIQEYCKLLLLQHSKQNVSVVQMMPQGILLFGPTGTGKSMLAQATANELGINTTHISPTDIFSKFLGETEKRLRNIFETASQRSPCLIIVDNIDALCPRKDSSQSDLEKRTLNTFLSLMDGMAKKASRAPCIVMGITSKADVLDASLRRASRFGMEVETGVPTVVDRLQILKKLLVDIPHSVSESQLKLVCDSAHGFVGADLAALVNKARQQQWEQTRDAQCELSLDDLRQAAALVKPSAMREVQFEVPKVKWSDIGGQDEVKLKLRQAVEWPLTHPDAFQRMGIKPPCGCLLYGPPGCSKTMIAKALATESGLNFLAVKGPELFGKYVGESERAVREIFRKARSAAPSIIFFDEIDSLAVERGKSSGGNSVADRVLTQLLTEMDGVVELKGVTIVAATNRPDMIDKALLRPGRFDRILYVPLPDDATRKEILQIVTKKTPVASDVVLDELVTRTEGFSGAELTALCQEAGLCAITESRDARLVHMRHVEAALKAVKPQTSPQTVQFYRDYSSKSGLHAI